MQCFFFFTAQQKKNEHLINFTLVWMFFSPINKEYHLMLSVLYILSSNKLYILGSLLLLFLIKKKTSIYNSLLFALFI